MLLTRRQDRCAQHHAAAWQSWRLHAGAHVKLCSARDAASNFVHEQHLCLCCGDNGMGSRKEREVFHCLQICLFHSYFPYSKDERNTRQQGYSRFKGFLLQLDCEGCRLTSKSPVDRRGDFATLQQLDCVNERNTRQQVSAGDMTET
eukprot:1158307-Pelagomonas_calceolata.AAC.2